MKKLYGLLFASLLISPLVGGCVGDDDSAPPSEAEAASGEQVHALAGKEDPGGPITPQGDCDDWWEPCGELQNNSVRAIDISLNWNCTITYDANQNSPCALSRELVASGHHRGGGTIDVDAFRVDSGCTYYGDVNGSPFQRGPGWYKFSSDQTVTISSTSCGLGSVAGAE